MDYITSVGVGAGKSWLVVACIRKFCSVNSNVVWHRTKEPIDLEHQCSVDRVDQPHNQGINRYQ